jgi:copper chaperone
MSVFDVPKMSCGHCVGTITRAITAANPTATVTADLERRRITVTGGSLDTEALRSIIADAGYTATAA